jgi:hypothetical protein
MQKYAVRNLNDIAIAQDGRTIFLNFKDASEQVCQLEFSALDLENVVVEVASALTKAREFSRLSQRGILSFLRPSRFRATNLSNAPTVVISFHTTSGLDLNVGLEPNDAETLALQIQTAAEQGRKIKAPSRN